MAGFLSTDFAVDSPRSDQEFRVISSIGRAVDS
jgi:hypothetical protein